MGRYNFIEKKSDKELPEAQKYEASRVSEVKALYYWNFSVDDDDRPNDIEILVKPIEASTPMPEDLPTGFFPNDQRGTGYYGFAGDRAWAFEMLDRDRRFIYDTSIGGIRPRDVSDGFY